MSDDQAEQLWRQYRPWVAKIIRRRLDSDWPLDAVDDVLANVHHIWHQKCRSEAIQSPKALLKRIAVCQASNCLKRLRRHAKHVYEPDHDDDLLDLRDPDAEEAGARPRATLRVSSADPHDRTLHVLAHHAELQHQQTAAYLNGYRLLLGALRPPAIWTAERVRDHLRSVRSRLMGRPGCTAEEFDSIEVTLDMPEQPLALRAAQLAGTSVQLNFTELAILLGREIFHWDWPKLARRLPDLGKRYLDPYALVAMATQAVGQFEPVFLLHALAWARIEAVDWPPSGGALWRKLAGLAPSAQANGILKAHRLKYQDRRLILGLFSDEEA